MLTKWSPFWEMSAAERTMRRLMSFDGFAEEKFWQPLVDVRENTKEIVVDVEIPGVNSKDVKVKIDKGILYIEGEKKLENTEKSDYYKTERYCGAFVRSFSLPTSANPEKISASYDKGVLKIVVPKKKEAVPREIEINNTG